MRTVRPALLVTLLLCCSIASAQTLPLDVELGYRWLDVSGSEDMYRSQINERSGLLIRSLNLADDYSGRSSLYDRFRLDVSELGVGPAGAARLDVSRGGLYTFHLSYRRAELFSALPAYANPLLTQGIVPGQHTFDRVRHLLDLDLELLPGKAVRPLVGYTRNRMSGPGRTTYTVGTDDFRLGQDLSTTEQEFRIGAAFDVGPVSGQVTQGWRKAHETETLTLAPGAGGGNSNGTVLGTPVSLSTFSRSTETDANTPVTNAVVTARLGERVRVLASYVRAESAGDGSEREALTGSLVSFPLRAIFAGSNETVSSHARDRFWSGGGRVEATLVPDVDLSAGFLATKHELDGAALVSTLLLGVVPFGGGTASDVQRLLEANTSVERTDRVAFARVHAKAIGPFAFTGGLSQTDQSVTVTPDASEIVVPGSQGGDFDRRIRSWELGATFGGGGFTLGAEIRSDHADRPVVRIDFVTRERYRVRAAWKKLSWLRVAAVADQTDSASDRPGIELGSRARQYSAELEVTPLKPLHVRLAAGAFQADSAVLFRRPEDFSIDRSVQSERGRFSECGLTLSLTKVTLDASYTSFDNKGTYPFRIGRARGRAEVPVTPSLSLAGEFAKDTYSETGPVAVGDYNADRYGLFVRWKQ